MESGKTRQFSGDEFASYLSGRANQIAQKKLEATLMEFGTVQLQRYTEQIQGAIRN